MPHFEVLLNVNQEWQTWEWPKTGKRQTEFVPKLIEAGRSWAEFWPI